MKKYILIIILAAIISACNPVNFVLNKNEDVTLYGLIMSALETVEISSKYSNTLLLRENARVALSTSKITQFNSKFTVEIFHGEGMRFSFRTISDSFDDHSSIQFDYNTEGSYIYLKDKLLVMTDTIKANAMDKKLIQISNNGDYFLVAVDCDTVYYGRTNLPATEYVIIETLGKTEVFVSGIEFAKLYEYNMLSE